MVFIQQWALFFAFIFAFSSCGLSYAQRGRGATTSEPGIQKLEEVFAWNQITYNIAGNSLTTNRFSAPVQGNNDEWTFPDNDEENSAPAPDAEEDPSRAPSQDQFFIQYNNVPMGVDRWQDKLFVTVPRRRAGIPSTLNYLSLTEDRNPENKSPALRPYPSLAANTLTSEKPLVNVYRTRVDACDRLWMVDTGLLEGSNSRTVQPPAIVIYDLKTDTLLKRFELNSDLLINSDPTGFVSITIDVSKRDCGSAYAYLNDILNYGVVVYSLKDDDAWRLYHNYFYFDPEDGDFDVAGQKYQWNDGVFSLALGPTQQDGYRTVYFHAMASTKERSINSQILRNKTLATRDYHGTDFKVVGDRGPNSQTTMHDIHQSTNVMFMAQVAKSALACWNTRKPLNKNNIGTVAQDTTYFIYPSDLKVDNDDIWVISNKLPVFIYGELDPNIINFRIYRTTVKSAVSGTVCA